MSKRFSMFKEWDSRKKLLLVVSIIFLAGIITILPKAFASLNPIKSVKIYSENANYEEGDQGAFEITKSGKWVAKGEAEVTFDVNTIKKIDSTNTDVILVLDVSGSMVGEKLTKVKSDSKDLIDNLFLNSKKSD